MRILNLNRQSSGHFGELSLAAILDRASNDPFRLLKYVWLSMISLFYHNISFILILQSDYLTQDCGLAY